MREQDLDDVIFGDPDSFEHGVSSERARERQQSSQRRVISLVVALSLLFGGGFFAYSQIKPMITSLTQGDEATDLDYAGGGTGEAKVVIKPGDSGSTIGKRLVDAGVVKTADSFAAALAANPRSGSIQPGTYNLRQQMSARAAVEMLLDPANREAKRVTLPEGLWASEAFTRLAKASNRKVGVYEKLDTAKFDLPKEANGKLDGYLFPATYEFSPDDSATAQVSQLVKQTNKRLDAAGIDEEDRHRILTIASIVQAEAYNPGDFPKVARVIENRLKAGMPLGMDSTVHYIIQKRGNVFTSDADRNSDSPYNTYKVTGLPPGPINSPGMDAIQAALHPAEGDWLYFATVNLDTGETVFTNSSSEHEAAVARLQTWCKTSDKC